MTPWPQKACTSAALAASRNPSGLGGRPAPGLSPEDQPNRKDIKNINTQRPTFRVPNTRCVFFPGGREAIPPRSEKTNLPSSWTGDFSRNTSEPPPQKTLTHHAHVVWFLREDLKYVQCSNPAQTDPSLLTPSLPWLNSSFFWKQGDMMLPECSIFRWRNQIGLQPRPRTPRVFLFTQRTTL